MSGKKLLRRLLRRDDANSAVEYAVMIAGVAALIVVIVFTLGSPVKAAFKSFCDSMNSRMGGSLTCSDGSPPPESPPAEVPATPPATPPSDGDDDDDGHHGGHHHGD